MKIEKQPTVYTVMLNHRELGRIILALKARARMSTADSAAAYDAMVEELSVAL